MWVSSYRYADKQHSITIGQYPQISLAEARQANADIRSQLAKGLNPKQEKRLQKYENESVQSFNDYALQWLQS